MQFQVSGFTAERRIFLTYRKLLSLPLSPPQIFSLEQIFARLTSQSTCSGASLLLNKQVKDKWEDEEKSSASFGGNLLWTLLKWNWPLSPS